MDYDLETDKLINFLFKDDTNNELQSEYENCPEFVTYLNKLGSMNVEQLYKEKKVVDEEMLSVENQMKHLALVNYKGFIHTADTSRRIYKDVCSIEEKLAGFLNETPNLVSECEKFKTVSTEIKQRRRRNNLILSNNVEILQILEIPQFMNACVHNEHYEEALTLPSFVKRLASKHGDVALINSIANDVDKSWWELLHHLLRHLTTDISLPNCLQIMGYLRRMNVFSEIELRFKFLQARGKWLDSLLVDIPCDDKNNHLNAVIDITRVNIFTIATQYKAVFTDDDVITIQNNLKTEIFHSWLNKRVNDFLAVIEADLSYCLPNLLDSFLGQCMYFGQSFGRIGADFRGLVINLFIKTIENNFEATIFRVDEQFTAAMKKFILPKSNLISNINIFKIDSTTDQQILSPPSCLLEFYPLAEYCNAVLSSFNDLRYCALIGCVERITYILQQSLVSVSKHLFSYHEKESMTWLENEKETFTRFCNCFTDSLIVFLQRCLLTLFETEKLLKFLGVSVSYLEEKRLGYLNLPEIRKPLESII